MRSPFNGLIEQITTLLPSNEEIGKAFRKEVPMYPELATRMEITNPGTPLVDTQRFLDSPPQSRNEALASFMRRINVCEESGLIWIAAVVQWPAG